MKVQELIRILSEFPQDATVVVNLNKNDLASGKEVASVSLADAYRYSDSPGWNADYYPEYTCQEEGEEKRVVVNVSG